MKNWPLSIMVPTFCCKFSHCFNAEVKFDYKSIITENQRGRGKNHKLQYIKVIDETASILRVLALKLSDGLLTFDGSRKPDSGCQNSQNMLCSATIVNLKEKFSFQMQAFM